MMVQKKINLGWTDNIDTRVVCHCNLQTGFRGLRQPCAGGEEDLSGEEHWKFEVDLFGIILIGYKPCAYFCKNLHPIS